MALQWGQITVRWLFILLVVAFVALEPAVVNGQAADPPTGTAAAIRVGDRPQGITVGGGAVWIAGLGTRAALHLDPRTNRVLAAVPLDLTPLGLALGAGGLWITGGFATVVRVDPQTNRVVTRIPVGLNPRIPVATADAVWVPNAGDGTVSRIDPQTNRVVATLRIGNALDCPAATGAPAVATGSGAVWVIDCAAHAIARIDPRTNQINGTIPLNTIPTALTLAGGALWVTSFVDDQVVRIDPRAGRVVARLALAGPQAVVGTADGAWVATASGAIMRIDTPTNRVTQVWAAETRPAAIPPSPVPSLPGLMTSGGVGSLAAGEGSVWVSRPGTGTVTRIAIQP